ncbi:hypothetical protein A9974_20060 [Achromobacter sp. UMC71]|nr:hypothetical protein [Achromobacter sp. UMC71]
MSLDTSRLLAVLGMLNEHWRMAFLIGLIVVACCGAILLHCPESSLARRGVCAVGGVLIGMLCLGAWAGRR